MRARAIKPKKSAKHRTAQVPQQSGIYTVEYIVDHNGQRGRSCRYLIKWLGYPSAQNTWEPESNVLDTLVLDEYWRSVDYRMRYV